MLALGKKTTRAHTFVVDATPFSRVLNSFSVVSLPSSSNLIPPLSLKSWQQEGVGVGFPFNMGGGASSEKYEAAPHTRERRASSVLGEYTTLSKFLRMLWLVHPNPDDPVDKPPGRGYPWHLWVLNLGVGLLLYRSPTILHVNFPPSLSCASQPHPTIPNSQLTLSSFPYPRK